MLCFMLNTRYEVGIENANIGFDSFMISLLLHILLIENFISCPGLVFLLLFYHISSLSCT